MPGPVAPRRQMSLFIFADPDKYSISIYESIYIHLHIRSTLIKKWHSFTFAAVTITYRRRNSHFK